MRYTYRYRSFFWPALLILAGVVALLVNTGQIPVDRLYQLLNLWPLVLIVIGLELILRRTVHGVMGDVAMALIVLLAIVGAAAYVTVSPNPGNINKLDTEQGLGEVKTARVEINAGAATINISSAARSDLYRAHVDYSGQTPDVHFDAGTGSLIISQRGKNFLPFQPRHFAVDLKISSEVAWAIDLNTGAATTTLDLADVHLSSISLNTGAAKDEITLGPATGVVPVEINGGALTVNIHRPGGTEASVDVSGGAVSLNADGRNMHAIGHLSFESPGYSGATNSYRVEVNGGACTVRLDKTAES